MMAGADDRGASAFSHRSVLLDASVEALVRKPDGRYIDGTFGRGGHSRLILGRLGAQGRLLAFDKDPDAIREAEALAAEDARFSWFHGSFAEIALAMARRGWASVDGVLLDLGVSSPQLDDPARGFSFMRDGPLDMRMDPRQSPSAAEWLATAEEQDIADVIWRYGEEKFSRRIARLLVERRQEAPIETTRQLAELVSEAVPRKERHKHPATRTFQAIRIFINRELEDLEVCLRAAAERLAPGGRLVVISFHSLEDRLVKRFMRDLARGPKLPRGVPVTADQERSDFRLVGRANRADEHEVNENIRARSAVMRVLERIERTDSEQGSA
ncbi:16S rRNA (cytosine(1402)-N(4))-methyltransferase RsmH [Marinobacter lutaoensis]|jgi:16S rRNA (cytosine1402-N4)-methyltransferase|uniref:16S rRNA (cytosine(1402)-N(4))-methyltransferase RsmH n=1 Tax=Marinobacter lutaoensis TaxID=135739 RepID=UPI000C4DD60C|nr:16S rRNA (cytosine(1402)-N(4))-methyltransferase RsmH [Marinobacter lutaoensis]MBI43583.1 16S rRNA (cytosine(1402)-N(4))-methyltransferase [Oceanospirillales bacterium]NVD35313.1 16S rRNA (cytosine(1402)-N(4))-methyltransferase RsmH [Marinobacter lutaoensis]|tara:strand:+ start:1020 stop:2003 length:984 start_codon:yes stop_codon:yes gene_type:complete